MLTLDLNEDFLVAMVEADADQPLRSDGEPKAAISIWGYSIAAIVKVVMDKAREWGSPYRSQIEAAGKQAIDRLVALDLPWIPDSIEGVIDAATKQLGYAAVVAILDALFAEQVQP
jgi:hypothetical protein